MVFNEHKKTRLQKRITLKALGPALLLPSFHRLVMHPLVQQPHGFANGFITASHDAQRPIFCPCFAALGGPTQEATGNNPNKAEEETQQPEITDFPGAQSITETGGREAAT